MIASVTSLTTVPDQWKRLNAVCPYYTMFPLDFPLAQLALYPDTTRVLDPFCGRGTTLYAARLAGVPAVGIDINPVAVAIARAKLARSSTRAVVVLARRLIREAEPVPSPTGEFWQWCYHDRVLSDLVRLRHGLLKGPNTSTADLLRAVILGVLHGPRNKGVPSYLSNQMPRTYASKPDYAVRFWRQRGLLPPLVDTVGVIARKAERALSELPPVTCGKVHLGDAASTIARIRERFDLVVTSPPYYAMRTYVADQWLRSWFLGGPSEVPYSTATAGQLARQPNQGAFTAALATTWRATASRCRPGARLVIRFGALPSSPANPEKIIIRSLVESAAGWIVRDVRPAGIPSRRSRQAEQFGRAGHAVHEVDVTAELVAGKR